MAQPELLDPATANALLGAENGIWLLVIVVLLRWVSQLVTERRGPHWASNGVMDRVISKIGKQVASDLSEMPANGEIGELLRTNQEIIQTVGLTLDHILGYHEKYAEGWPRMVQGMQECSEKHDSTTRNLEAQSKALAAIAREFNRRPLCALSSHQREEVIRDSERRERIEAAEKAKDMGLSNEELGL